MNKNIENEIFEHMKAIAHLVKATGELRQISMAIINDEEQFYANAFQTKFTSNNNFDIVLREEPWK